MNMVGDDVFGVEGQAKEHNYMDYVSMVGRVETRK